MDKTTTDLVLLALPVSWGAGRNVRPADEEWSPASDSSRLWRRRGTRVSPSGKVVVAMLPALLLLLLPLPPGATAEPGSKERRGGLAKLALDTGG